MRRHLIESLNIKYKKMYNQAFKPSRQSYWCAEADVLLDKSHFDVTVEDLWSFEAVNFHHFFSHLYVLHEHQCLKKKKKKREKNFFYTLW